MEVHLEALRDALIGMRTLNERGKARAALGLSAAEQYGAPSYQYAVLLFPEPIPAGTLCETMAGHGPTRAWAI
jgi:hypothetical protein